MAAKNVVVVGGGFAGAATARALSQQLVPNQHKLTLITSREFFICYPGALRMLASSEGNLEDQVLIPYEKLFVNGNGNLVVASVTSIVRNPNSQGGHVLTDKGERIPFDVLILATGSKWEGGIKLPATRADAVAEIKEWRTKFENAGSIVMVGGGPVGIELAGELRHVYPKKKLTIVHNKHHLTNDVYPEKFRKDLENRLAYKNIDVILDDSIDSIPSGPLKEVVTARGTRITADLVVPTRGGSPNTDFIKTLSPDVLNSEGRVKVETTLQVHGFPEIFAGGDITDWKEVKQAAKFSGQSVTLAKNVVAFLKAGELSVYKPLFEGVFISIGPNGGGAYMDILWGLCFGDWVTKHLKSKHLFVPQTRASLGL